MVDPLPYEEKLDCSRMMGGLPQGLFSMARRRELVERRKSVGGAAVDCPAAVAARLRYKDFW